MTFDPKFKLNLANFIWSDNMNTTQVELFSPASFVLQCIRTLFSGTIRRDNSTENVD